MKCREAEKLVQPYIDGKLGDRECADFIAHVRPCPNCYEELETYYTIDYALRNMDDTAERSFDMKKVVDEDLREMEKRIRINRLRSIVIGVALLFGACMLAVGVFSHFLPQLAERILSLMRMLFV